MFIQHAQNVDSVSAISQFRVPHAVGLGTIEPSLTPNDGSIAFDTTTDTLFYANKDGWQAVNGFSNNRSLDARHQDNFDKTSKDMTILQDNPKNIETSDIERKLHDLTNKYKDVNAHIVKSAEKELELAGELISIKMEIASLASKLTISNFNLKQYHISQLSFEKSVNETLVQTQSIDTLLDEFRAQKNANCTCCPSLDLPIDDIKKNCEELKIVNEIQNAIIRLLNKKSIELETAQTDYGKTITQQSVAINQLIDNYAFLSNQINKLSSTIGVDISIHH